MTEDEVAYLHECLNEVNGVLIWKARPLRHFADSVASQKWHTRYVGREAGNKNQKGYKRFNLSGKYYLCHRIVFLFVNGYLPKFVDHSNRVRVQNEAENLREATSRQNAQNSGPKENSTSKYKGVSWSEDKQKWRVYCTDPSLGRRPSGRARQQYLGQTNCEITAAKLYDDFAEKRHGEFAWLNRNHFEEVRNAAGE